MSDEKDPLKGNDLLLPPTSALPSEEAVALVGEAFEQAVYDWVPCFKALGDDFVVTASGHLGEDNVPMFGVSFRYRGEPVEGKFVCPWRLHEKGCATSGLEGMARTVFHRLQNAHTDLAVTMDGCLKNGLRGLPDVDLLEDLMNDYFARQHSVDGCWRRVYRVVMEHTANYERVPADEDAFARRSIEIDLSAELAEIQPDGMTCTKSAHIGVRHVCGSMVLDGPDHDREAEYEDLRRSIVGAALQLAQALCKDEEDATLARVLDEDPPILN